MIPLLAVLGVLIAAAATEVQRSAKRRRAEVPAAPAVWYGVPASIGWKVVHWHHVGPKDDHGVRTPLQSARAIHRKLAAKGYTTDGGLPIGRKFIAACINRYAEYGDPFHRPPRMSGAEASTEQRKWIKALLRGQPDLFFGRDRDAVHRL